MTRLLLEFRNIFVFIICSFGSAMILLAMFLIMFYGCFKVTTILLKLQFAVMFLLFDIEVLYLFFHLIQSLYSLYTIDIVIIIGLLCNSKVLFKNQQQKIQATYTYEKLQDLKKNHDF